MHEVNHGTTRTKRRSLGGYHYLMRCALSLLLAALASASFASAKGKAKKAAAEKDGGTALAKPDVTTTYGPVADRQKVNLYLAPASRPCPVFLLAHSNGETFNDVHQVLVDICKSRGISVVSWESVVNLSRGKIDTLWADSKVILQWIKDPEIARQYRFDPTQIILYGGSRGSWASWQIGHSGDPAIKGLFLYRALPRAISTMPEVYEMITKNSPPALFMYHPTDTKGATHDMRNGQLAVQKYESLGLADRVMIDTKIKSKEDGFVKHLPDFIKRVLPKEFHGL